LGLSPHPHNVYEAILTRFNQLGVTACDIHHVVHDANHFVNAPDTTASLSLPTMDNIGLGDLLSSLQAQIGASKKHEVLSNLISVIFHLTYLVCQVSVSCSFSLSDPEYVF